MTAGPRLTDGTIVVRPCGPEDVDCIYSAVRQSIRELVQWAPWCSPDYSKSYCEAWLNSRASARTKGDEFDFSILDTSERTILGGCGLYDINRTHNFANLGYWVSSIHAGKGVATAAARLIASWGFTEKGFTRLEIVAAVGNLASHRVAEKVGAVREGIQRNRHHVNGQMHDAVMFSLIPSDLV